MHILMIAPRFPLPAIKGDKLRAWLMLRTLSKHHEISLVTYTTSDEERDRMPEVGTYCDVRAAPFHRWTQWPRTLAAAPGANPFQTAYYRSRAAAREISDLISKTDAIHLNTLRMAENLPRNLASPLVVDFVDAISLGLQRRAEAASGTAAHAFKSEARRVALMEKSLAESAAAAFCVSEVDATHIDSRVRVCPHGIDLDTYTVDHGHRAPGLITLSGNLSYPPNIDAAIWTAKEVMPILRRDAKAPVRLRIAGASPSPAVTRLACSDIEVKGFVADMAKELQKASVAVAPMRMGSGVQTKVIEAMACGVPVVATPRANVGINAQDGEAIRIADDADTFAAAIRDVLTDNEQWQRLAQGGRRFVEANHSAETALQPLLEAYEELVNV